MKKIIDNIVIPTLITVATVIVITTLVVSPYIYFHKNDVLVSKQTTCYGKVLQNSWSNESAKTLALQACNGK